MCSVFCETQLEDLGKVGHLEEKALEFLLFYSSFRRKDKKVNGLGDSSVFGLLSLSFWNGEGSLRGLWSALKTENFQRENKSCTLLPAPLRFQLHFERHPILWVVAEQIQLCLLLRELREREHGPVFVLGFT